MRKIDKTVLNETGYIAAWVLALSAVMQAVFLIIGRWNYTVLLGNLLSGVFSVINFLLMGITVQIAVENEEKSAANKMKLSQTLRSLMMGLVLIVGIFVPVFNTVAVVIPIFFPRIGVGMRSLFMKKER